ncbi:MAG: FG-GAP-like repeat-containing protein [Planctomycetota bacterium]
MRTCSPIAIACFVAAMTTLCSAQSLSWEHLSTATGDIEPPTLTGSEQPDSWILDVDQDGLQDFVVCERIVAPSMLWYRRHPGGWDRYVIDDTQLHLTAGGEQYDVDGDGDLDLIGVGSYLSNQVWWFENPFPNYDPATPWVRHNLKASGGPTQHDSVVGDFDGDGVDEFVFWNQGGYAFPDNYLFLTEFPDNPKTLSDWPRTLIYSGSSASEGLAKADIDGDGVIDIVGGGHWFKHNGGTSFTALPIYPNRAFSQVAVGQMIAGDRPEVVVSSGDIVGPLEMYVWDGASWVSQPLLPFDTFNAHSVQVVDFDGDGNLDVFAGEMNLNQQNPDAKTWVFLGDGVGGFTTVEVYSGFGIHNSKVGDLDGDGDMDILGKPFNWDVPRIDVWLTNGTGLPIDQWQKHLIDTTPWQSGIIYAEDLNGDGRDDLVAGGWWWANPGNVGDPWLRSAIGAPLHNLAAVHDYDGDGHLDIVGTETKLEFPLTPQANGHRLHWAKGDGSGNFVVDYIGDAPGTTGVDFLQGISGGVYTPGGPFTTILSWQDGETGATPVQSLIPPVGDPTLQPWTFGTLHPTSLGEGVSTADIDGDGDLDVFQGTKWLQNDGNGNFTQHTTNTDILVFGLTDRNRLADIDRDGDLDAVVGFAHFEPAPTTSFVWLEQPADPTQPWPAHLIGTNLGGGYSIDVADLDLDGDTDIVLGEHIGLTRLLIFENLGDGSQWNERVVDAGGPGMDHHLGSRVRDLDGDGDLDIFSIGWTNDKVWVFENLGADNVIDLTPPEAPTQVTATPVDDQRIQISWAANSAEDFANFHIHRSNQPNFVPSPMTLIGTLTSNSFYDDGHGELETYYYAVVANDLSGNGSQPSTTVAATTLPDTSPPRPARVRALSSSTIRVDFDEDIASASATTPDLFAINGLTVLAATPSGTNAVILTTSTMVTAEVYTLSVTGVFDMANTPNSGGGAANFVSGASLEALYLLDEVTGSTAPDASGNGHDGVMAGAAWSSDSAPGGVNSLSFDGATGRVEANPFDTGTPAISFALWFRAESLTVADARLLSKAVGVGSADHFWMLSTILDNDVPRLRWRLKAGGNTETLIPPAAEINIGAWIHVAAVYNGVTMSLYQDGVLVAQQVKSGAVDQAPGVAVALGNQPTGAGDRPFHGALDEVAIYGRALTPEEVAALAAVVPETLPDLGSVDFGSSTIVPVLDNDGSPATTIDSTSVAVVVAPSAGSTNVDPTTGAITFTHDGASTSSVFEFLYTVSSDSGVVSNPTSVRITVNGGGCTAPTIDVNPIGTVVCADTPFTLAVHASGTAPLTYQWRRNGIPLPGATTSALAVPNAQALDGGNYDVTVTNACGSAISANTSVFVVLPPVIQSGPVSATHCAGSAATLTATASGSALQYQWYRNGVSIPGANATTLALAAIVPADAGAYEVVVSNSCGAVTSASALLAIDTPATIALNPQPINACEGAGAVLTAGAIGSEPIAYQWRYNGAPIAGETGGTLLIPALSLQDAGDYDVVVSNVCGSTASVPVTITVDPLPQITTAPTDQHLCAGDSVVLAVSATGGTGYQWRKDGVPIPGATLSSYSIGNAVQGDAGVYSVQVAGNCGNVASSAATVTISDVPTVVAGPTAQATCEGFSVAFSVVVDDPLATLQWRHNGINIPGATGVAYSLPSTSVSDAGSYDVVVISGCGFSISTPAQLDVVPQWDCDCNANGQLDSDELATGNLSDCNSNGVPDECDLSAGTSLDSNLDGVPDECSATFLRGDCNGDTMFDISDPVQLLDALFIGGRTLSCLDACDGNDDGLVNLSDVVSFLCAMFCSPWSPLPDPFGACGIDPTGDAIDCSISSCP